MVLTQAETEAVAVKRRMRAEICMMILRRVGGLDVEGFGDVQVVRGAGNREDALFLSTSNESILAMSGSY